MQWGKKTFMLLAHHNAVIKLLHQWSTYSCYGRSQKWCLINDAQCPSGKGQGQIKELG